MRLHLFGDSVFRGAVTDISDNPAQALRALQSPAAIMNLATGKPVAELAGQTGIPKSVQLGEAEIAARLQSGKVGPDDVLVFLDVGVHAMDTRQHEADWLRLRRAAVASHDVDLIMCSGFDHGARGQRAQQHEAPLDGRSPNDAVRAAALAGGDFRGRTRFLDVAAPLKALHATLKPRFGASPYFRDCVHLTVWGQICLSLLILRAAGGRPSLPRLAQTVDLGRSSLGLASRADALEIVKLTAVAAGVRSRRLELALLGARARRRARALAGAEPDAAHVPSAFVQTLVERGAELEQGGAIEEALAHYRKAAALDGACVAAHQGRLRAAALAGDRPAEAIEAGRAALALDPKGGKYYVWLAQAMLAARADGELVGWLDALAEVHAPPRAFAALAELTDALGDPERARLWATRAAYSAEEERS